MKGQSDNLGVTKATTTSNDNSNDNKSAAVPVSEWKNYLSGAMSDTQLYLALCVLLVFYFIYTLYNAYHSLDRNVGQQDEGEIIRNCTCEEVHRKFYLVLIIACCVVWLILHTGHALTKLCPSVTKYLKQKVKQNIKQKLKCCNKAHDDQTDSSNAHIHSGLDKNEMKFRKSVDQKIAEWKKSLYSRHYEMYAIGIKNDPSLSLKELKKLIKIVLLSPELRKNPSAGYFQESADIADGDDGNGESVHNLCHKVKRMILGLFHIFLQVALFLVQLSVVPLLIFQILDTYTWLCLAEKNYCDTESQYRLHLHQTAISFAFYCALMISLLVTRWLTLVTSPWKIEKIACCKKIIERITDNRALLESQV